MAGDSAKWESVRMVPTRVDVVKVGRAPEGNLFPGGSIVGRMFFIYGLDCCPMWRMELNFCSPRM